MKIHESKLLKEDCAGKLNSITYYCGVSLNLGNNFTIHHFFDELKNTGQDEELPNFSIEDELIFLVDHNYSHFCGKKVLRVCGSDCLDFLRD